MTYGNWTIIGNLENSPAGKRRVLARCKCGSEHAVQLGNLRSGKSIQCRSCAKSGRPSNRRTHGEAMAKTVEWRTWRSIRNRCEQPYNKSYDHYGGRGIVVCDRWQGPGGFSNFLADMGRRPGPSYSIDRRDNDGPYSPGNCRWATVKEQLRNTRTNRMLTIEDRTLCLADWADLSEDSYHTIHGRLRRGWNPAEAVFGKK